MKNDDPEDKTLEKQMTENTFINRGGAKAKMEALMMVLAVQSCNVFLIFYK